MRKLFLILLVLNCVAATAQKDTSPPVEVRKFILKDYSVYHYVKGDLNGDGREDAILILKYNSENDTIDYRQMVKPFIVLFRNPKNKFYQALRNDSLMPLDMTVCNFGGIEIDKKKSAFNINFWGGRRDKWRKELTFAYKTNYKNWHLILQKETSFDAAEMKLITDENFYIKEEELKGITLSNFNFDKEVERRDAMVSFDSTFFYSQPDKKSKHRRVYLVKGDRAEVISETTNFVYVYFTNKQAKSTMGFLLKKDLRLIPKR